jgi:uncharacterized protein YacL
MFIQIPVRNFKKPHGLKFPQRCTNCGKAHEEVLTLSLHTGSQVRSLPQVLAFKVPMCKACADKERSIAKVTLVPFLVGGLIFGVIAFVPAMFISPEGTTPQTLNFPVVFGGLVGLIVGMIFGTIVEVVVKMLAMPFYGKTLARRPLTVFSLFHATDEFVGISVNLLVEKKVLQFEFENEEIAYEFAKINQLENQ